jgi:hypothetical protein
VDFGGAENKNYVVGRFFQGFQESIGGLVGEHVSFVDDIHLASALSRGEIHLLSNVPDLVDAPVASSVKLDNVQETALADRQAYSTGVTWVIILKGQAIYCLG